MKKNASSKIFDSKNPDLKSYSKINNYNKNYHENGKPNYFDDYEDNYATEFSEELFARNSFKKHETTNLDDSDKKNK